MQLHIHSTLSPSSFLLPPVSLTSVLWGGLIGDGQLTAEGRRAAVPAVRPVDETPVLGVLSVDACVAVAAVLPRVVLGTS